jgi:hypothetical protein
LPGDGDALASGEPVVVKAEYGITKRSGQRDTPRYRRTSVMN